MEISSQTTPRLLGLNNLPIEELRTLCKYFLQALITGTSTADIDEDLQPETLALSIFLLEVSKVRSSSDTVRKLLLQLGLTEEVSNVIYDIYDKYHGKILEHMEATGIALPSIVGLTVRGDVIPGSETPLFYITLKVSDRGLVNDVEMIADKEQLQDFLFKIKDALKQTDRILNS